MKKLIAKRPIQYMGRTYDVGEPVPAYEEKMVCAWLAAGSVEWTGETAATAATVLATSAAMTADALRDMGIPLEDESAFLNVGSMEELIANTINAIVATHAAPENGAAGQEGEDGAGDGGGASEAGQDAQEGKLLTGHLDANDLAKMKKPDLEKLAADMGVDISAAKNNDERAALIAAVPVQAPANENGGAQ